MLKCVSENLKSLLMGKTFYGLVVYLEDVKKKH